jgi:YHS domain-containing protein
MLTTMVAAALVVDGLFSFAGIVPTNRPTTSDVFARIHLDYNLAFNILAVGIFVALFGLTIRRGVKDPMCGMTVDRNKALQSTRGGQTYSFCSEGCRTRFLEGPESSRHH